MNILEIRKELYDRVLTEKLDESTLHLFIAQDNNPIQKECELWDYKREIEHSTTDYGKTIRSICAIHNSHGGYLVYGIEEIEKDKTFRATGISKSLDMQALKGSMDKFLSRRIDIHHKEFEITIENEKRKFAVLLIPKRPQGQPSISTIKDCNDAKKTIFTKHATFIRQLDECIAATLESHFQFLNSSRDPFSEKTAATRKIIPHNLPDKNFICQDFVGRDDIIQALWAWLSDDFDYIKVLAGEGGKGKTSIAYEFARLLATSDHESFDQIIWLTAKLKQFKAEAGRFVATPEQHYADLESLLKKICEETGATEEELEETPIQQLKRLAKGNLDLIPSFIIIDDVDSTSPEEQKKILETSRAISNQHSKILLTTRANRTYSADLAISVPGLSGTEYEVLVNSLSTRMGTAVPNKKHIEFLAKASSGSPLFTESIFRLVKLGMPFDKAIDEWKEKSGEEVRSAALQREIEQLSNTSKRILLAATIIGTCSLTELADITEIDKHTIQNSIEELNSLFLIQSPAIISQEPRFEVSDTTSRLVLSISEQLVPNHRAYISKIKSHSTSLTLAKSGKSRKGVGAAISQANALLKNKEFEAARETIRSTLKKPQYKDNPDLLLMLGRIEFSDTSKPRSVSISKFQEAYRRGQTKEILFDLWLEALEPDGNAQEKIEVCNLALEKTSESKHKWINRLTSIHINKIHKQSKPETKIKNILEAYESISNHKKPTTTNSRNDDLEHLIDLLYQECSKLKDYYFIGAKALVHAIKNGDSRTINFERYADLLSKSLVGANAKLITDAEAQVSMIDQILKKLSSRADYKITSRLQSELKRQLTPTLSEN